MSSELVILRYPARDGDKWVVVKPSDDDREVYEIASSWCDTLGEAKEELRRLRRMRGEVRR